jgi:hypothetical protein
MSKLHQVLAVMNSLKDKAAKITQETIHVFRSKHERFSGLRRTYKPLIENGQELPSEEKPLATTVGEKLAHFSECYIPYLDALFQVDLTNTKALAEIEVDEFKVLNVPSTFLMQLDKRLNEIRNVINLIPTLDPGYKWIDSNEGAGVWRVDTPQTRFKTKKTLKFQEISPATKEHRAQVEKWTEDETIGVWEEILTSGGLTVHQKYLILDRLDKLQIAVKSALAQANNVDQRKEKIGSKLFKYLLNDIPLSRGSNQSGLGVIPKKKPQRNLLVR